MEKLDDILKEIPWWCTECHGFRCKVGEHRGIHSYISKGFVFRYIQSSLDKMVEEIFKQVKLTKKEKEAIRVIQLEHEQAAK